MHKKNWDDFRVVLAVCEAGSVNGAAKTLGLNHATILRRVAGFEDRHGVSIFSKSAKGYKLNANSTRILNSLRSLDTAVVELERRLQGHESALSGVVRITSTDSFADRVLPDLVVELCKNQQGLQVNLITTNHALDLDKTEADIALRSGPEAPIGLVSDEVCRLGIALYRRKNSGSTKAGSGAATGAGQLDWVRRTGLSKDSSVSKWQEQSIKDGTIAAQADTFVGVASLISMGAGGGMLPCILGDNRADLERIETMPAEISPCIWLACHPDMADLPHIRTTYDFLLGALRLRKPLLTGQAS